MSLSHIPLLVLAGGRATRLGLISDDTPKFLVSISEQLRFADVQLAWAKKQGFARIVLSVGYKGDSVRAYCGDGSRFGLTITYADDGPAPLGTAGAVKRAFVTPPPQLCVLYGDTILDLDCAQAVWRAQQSGAAALMTVLEHPPKGHACNAQLEADRVSYSKTSPSPDWTYIDYGFLVLSAGFVNGIGPDIPLDLAVPLEAASRAGQLAGMQARAPFWEINTPEALSAFRARFAPHG